MSGSGYITGQQARIVLSESGLPTAELRCIWDLADSHKRGRLDRHEFVISQFLIQRRLAGHALPDTLPAGLWARDIMPATTAVGSGIFGSESAGDGTGVAINVPGAAAVGGGSNGMPGSFAASGSGPYAQNGSLNAHSGSQRALGAGLSPRLNANMREYARFAEQFGAVDRDADGFIAGQEAKHILRQSELPQSDLRRIWDLADITKDGRLDRHEFAVAMVLISARRAGSILPDVLPPALRAPPAAPHTLGQDPATELAASARAVSPGPALDTNPLQPFAAESDEAKTGPGGMETTAKMGSGAPLLPSVFDLAPPVESPIGENISVGEFDDALSAEDMMTGPSTVAEVSQSSNRGVSILAEDVLAEPSRGLKQSGGSDNEATEQELEQAYEEFADKFATLDVDGDGFITGTEARPVLMQWALEINDLRMVWDISDIHGDGKLDKHEFVIAMMLCQRRQRGIPLPANLPPALRAPPPRRLTPPRAAKSTAEALMPQHSQLEEALGIETRALQHPNEPHINSAGGHTMMPAAASVPADMFETDLFSSQGIAGAGREAEGGGRSETRVVSQAVPRKSPTLSQMMADSLSLANLDLEMAADKLPAAFGFAQESPTAPPQSPPPPPPPPMTSPPPPQQLSLGAGTQGTAGTAALVPQTVFSSDWASFGDGAPAEGWHQEPSSPRGTCVCVCVCARARVCMHACMHMCIVVCM